MKYATELAVGVSSAGFELDGVGSAGHAQDPDLGSGVERGQSALAQLADQRLGLLEVAEHAMAQYGGEASAVHRLVGVLASACRSVTRCWASAGSRPSRCWALSSIVGDGSSKVTSYPAWASGNDW
jgi:hypothetical protein